ncbi:MAG TPA: hypothetical protein VLE95_04760 [Chlamydiales bacterium]|nr:hypothetical protein [Chlamydiales bacterium]
MSLEIPSFDVQWLERGWWTATEAFCVFVGVPPDTQNDDYVLQGLRRRFSHIYDLVVSAEIDKAVQDMTRMPSGILQASCKSWISWGLTKQSIAVNLGEDLTEAVGIDFDKLRSLASYRPEGELLLKIQFQAVARVAIHISPKARLEDIKSLMRAANISNELLSDKTLRKWVNEMGVHLTPTRPSDDDIQETLAKFNL